MSYILDALRRADSEREQGAVPDLYARPAAPAVEAAAPSLATQPWVWIVAGGAVGVLVPLMLYLTTREPAAPATARTAMPAPAAPVAAALAPEVAPAAMVAPPVPAPAASPPQPATAPPPAPPRLKPREPAARKAVAADVPTKRTTDKPIPGGTEVGAATIEPRVPLAAELPAEIRRELPNVVVTGSMYSNNPANRMLIVSGQLFHEGDQLSPNLKLELIKQKAAVLNYKGHRYEIGF